MCWRISDAKKQSRGIPNENDVSDLMDIFTEKDAYDFGKFPRVSVRKRQFKETEKGAEEMCAVIEEYAED